MVVRLHKMHAHEPAPVDWDTDWRDNNEKRSLKKFK